MQYLAKAITWSKYSLLPALLIQAFLVRFLLATLPDTTLHGPAMLDARVGKGFLTLLHTGLRPSRFVFVVSLLLSSG
jgi:hypothetical protein